jgi:hypothetical protein
MKGLWLLLPAALYAQAPPFDQRVRSVVEAYAHAPGPMGYANIAAKLWLHEDAAGCSRRLEEILAAGPTGDMFWMYPVTAVAYTDQGQLSDSARRALREAWRTYMPYRGDTENHWVMYYTSLYLTSQLWPDQVWYTGKTSAENMREAAGWLESWVKLTTTRGQGEYDSPSYMGYYMLSMSYLAAWANDPAMKKRASMTIEYLTADYAAETLDGVFVGAHSRVYDREVLEKWAIPASDFGWVLFGLGHPLAPPSNAVLFYVLASAQQAPEILQHIASDRSEPYTEYELKRTRNRWRFFDDLHGPVYKTTYVRREYAVSSDQGGTLQPIQEHSWDVTWTVPDPRGVQNTFFTLNPHSSLHELETYFTFPADIGMSGVVSSKKSYDSPDKFVGGSPYEQITQDRDTLIALYDIAPGARFPHINGFFSKDLAETIEDPSGWIFARGGDALIACRPLQPYVWKPIEGGGRRLFSPYLKNGIVVQVAARSEFPDMQAFRQAILALPLQFSLEGSPHVKFQSLRGKTLEFTYGQPRDNADWPLFSSPFLEAAKDSEMLVMKYRSMRRTLDFRRLMVTESR